MILDGVSRAPGLSDTERDCVEELLAVWNDKLERNRIKRRYYEQKNTLHDLGISIPPILTNLNEVVGWPAKAVDVLAVRSVFDGFSFDDGEDHGLADVVHRNRLKLVYSQAVIDELVNSVAFLTVSKGGPGEPPVVVSAYSALNAAAVWDDRLKRIRHGLAVVDVERSGPEAEPEPVWVNLYTEDAVVEIHKQDGDWRADRHTHKMGRPTMEPMPYRARLDRPFGKSRISRAVMSITDNAVREAVRSEVAAEFFTSPQRYILGADDSIFEKNEKWQAYIGLILALTKDADGDTPQVGQFPAMSMQPHIDYKRDLAAQFSGETCVPISELGVIHDNPASAEAIYAAKESLVIEAEKMNEANGEALGTVARMALAILGNKSLDKLDDAEASVRARFKNPARPSIVSQSDAITKLATVIPGVAESDVALEEVGFDEDQTARIKRDRDKARAQQMISQAMQNQAAQPTPSVSEITSIIRSYRAGEVGPDTAVSLFATIGVDEAQARAYLADVPEPPEPQETQETAEGADEDDTEDRAGRAGAAAQPTV